MKLLITGGHLTPALAFIDEVLSKKILKNTDIVFVGRKYVNLKDKELSLEYKEIQARKIRFIHLHAGRLNRFLSLQGIVNLLAIPRGFSQSVRILSHEKPRAVLTFGGYVAVPIALIAWIMRISVYTHEQTIAPGLANRLIGKFSNKVFVSFPQTAKIFGKKAVVSGNLIRKYIFEISDAAFTINKHMPVIYVTGGSTGSHAINLHMEKILSELLENYIVIHQTGNVQEYGDYERLVKFREALKGDLRKNYFVRPHFLTSQMGHIFSLTDLVISRAGANTFFELVALRKPAILIPLPWSGGNEQELQAQIFQKAEVGEIFHQTENSDQLLDLISRMMVNLKEYKKNFETLIPLYKPNAAEIITKTIIR